MSGIAEFTPEFFDEASAAWRANKKHLGDGMFKYIRACRVIAPKPIPPSVPKRLVSSLASIPPLRRSPRFSRA